MAAEAEAAGVSQKVDAGADPNDPMQIPMTVKSMAWLAARLQMLQCHAYYHSKSCFKSQRCGCRYLFPHCCKSGPEFIIMVKVGDDGTEQPAGPGSTVDDITEVRLQAGRGLTAAWINRWNPAIVLWMHTNNDCTILLSSPGVSQYVTMYAAKMQRDTNIGYEVMSAFVRALKIEQDPFTGTAAPGGTSEQDLKKQATRRVLMCMSASTAKQTICPPMASYHLLFGERARFSHDFSSIHIQNYTGYISESGTTSYSLYFSPAGEPAGESTGDAPPGEEEVGATTPVFRYTERGGTLDTLSLYELQEYYHEARISKADAGTADTAGPATPPAPPRNDHTGELLFGALPESVPYTTGRRQLKGKKLLLNAKRAVPIITGSGGSGSLPRRPVFDRGGVDYDKEAAEQYALHAMILFMPWRCAGDLRAGGPDGEISHQAKFEAWAAGSITLFARRMLGNAQNHFDSRKAYNDRAETDPTTSAGFWPDPDNGGESEGSDDDDPFDWLDTMAALSNEMQMVLAIAGTELCNPAGELNRAWAPADGDPGTYAREYGAFQPWAPAQGDIAAIEQLAQNGAGRGLFNPDDAKMLPPSASAGAATGGAAAPSPADFLDISTELLNGPPDGDGVVGELNDRIAALPIRPTIAAVSKAFQLNREQHIALTAMAGDLALQFILRSDDAAAPSVELQDIITRLKQLKAATGGGPDNAMTLCLLGEGGTGKSHTIRAHTTWAAGWGLRDSIRVCATTGAAAGLIGGRTFHNLFKLGGMSKPMVVDKEDSSYYGILQILVDEISMLSRQNLGAGVKNLQALTGKTSTPAGNVSLILCGDFHQIKPVSGDPIYLAASDGISTDEAEGANTWGRMNAAVTLIENKRCTCKDLQTVLDATRAGDFTSPGAGNALELLRSRQLNHGRGIPATAGGVFHSNKSAMEWAAVGRHLEAAEQGAGPLFRITAELYRGDELQAYDNAAIYNKFYCKWPMAGNQDNGPLPYLDFHFGDAISMPLGNNNYLDKFGLGNGSLGTIVGVWPLPTDLQPPQLEDTTLPGGVKSKVYRYVHDIEFILVQLTTPEDKERFQFGQTNGHSDDGAPLPAEGLPVGVFPLPRSKFTWGKKSKGAGATRPKASIRYFPVRLTKARTVHKAQGARIPTLLIGGNENFYTAISRGVKLDDIYLLKDVTQATLKACQPSAEKAAALAHHAKIADETARLLDPDRT